MYGFITCPDGRVAVVTGKTVVETNNAPGVANIRIVPLLYKVIRERKEARRLMAEHFPPNLAQPQSSYKDCSHQGAT